MSASRSQGCENWGDKVFKGLPVGHPPAHKQTVLGSKGLQNGLQTSGLQNSQKTSPP